MASRSEGRSRTDYTPFLDEDALDGARIGVLRDALGADDEVDWIVESSLEAMREAGAAVVDVRLPGWLLEAEGAFYTTIRWREFRDQIPDYLATLGPEYPKTLAEMVARSRRVTGPLRMADGPIPTAGRPSRGRRPAALSPTQSTWP